MNFIINSLLLAAHGKTGSMCLFAMNTTVEMRTIFWNGGSTYIALDLADIRQMIAYNCGTLMFRKMLSTNLVQDKTLCSWATFTVFVCLRYHLYCTSYSRFINFISFKINMVY